VGLASGVFGDHGEDDLAGREELEAFLARDEFAVRWEDGGDANEVLGRDAGVAERELEGGETFFMLADAFGEKKTRGNHVFAQFEDPPGGFAGWE
jgi:hypothetical protein